MKKTILKICFSLGTLFIALPVAADLAPIGTDYYLAPEPILPPLLIWLIVLVLTVSLTLFLEFAWYFFGLGKTVRPLRRVGTWLAANAVTLPIILIAVNNDDSFTTVILAETIITLLEMLLIGTIAKSVSWVRAGWVALAANLTSALIGTSLFVWMVSEWLYYY